MIPETDVFVAKKRKLRFYVCKKEQPRGRWVRLLEDADLENAMDLANGQAAAWVEVGVFMSTPSGGFIYWTSTMPDVYNSTILRYEHSIE